MINEFVEAFHKGQDELKATFSKHPNEYKDVVKAVVTVIAKNIDSPDRYQIPDPERIHEINDGEYQGNLLYLIAADSYQPSVYWYVMVYYGSCSACDTLENIRSDYTDYDERVTVSEKQLKDYMMLALHIVQGIKLLDCDIV